MRAKNYAEAKSVRIENQTDISKTYEFGHSFDISSQQELQSVTKEKSNIKFIDSKMS